MNYGLYLSAAGVVNSAYQQDVIANNLANSETTGFKRDLALVMARKPEAQRQGGTANPSPTMLAKMGGGIFAAPTSMDTSQGDIDITSNPLDVAIVGRGYFAVDSQGKQYLTRAGNFTIGQGGALTLSGSDREKILGQDLQPIVLDPRLPANIDQTGAVIQNNKVVGKLALLDADSNQLTKHGGNLLESNQAPSTLSPANAAVRDKCLEKSNVDASTEITRLMETQRQLEANANMIRCQDETLDKLVNDVGRIS